MGAQDSRQVTDAKVLAVPAHPLRRRLMDVLKVDGPATATAMAARTGQAVANVSHHVRMMHRVGLVEEASELARDGRERWWRLTSPSLRWSSVDFADDPAGAAAASAAESVNLDHHLAAVRAWYAASDERPQWRNSAFSTDRWLRLTPAELSELSQELVALLERWAERPAADDPEREPVFVFSYGVPAQP